MALGGRTIAEWKEVMSGAEFTEWMAYYQLSPFDDYRGDVRAALVASTIANANASKGKKYSIKDFMVTFRSSAVPCKEMSGQEILGFMQGLQQQQG